MPDERIPHERIEGAYVSAREAIKRLPDITESREARRLLDISEDLAHRAREKTLPPAEE